MRIAVRLYVRGVLHSKEELEVDPSDVGFIRQLAEKHALIACQAPSSTEIEFLDEPDVNARFFRIGTDPRGMVNPVAVAIGGGETVQ